MKTMLFKFFLLIFYIFFFNFKAFSELRFIINEKSSNKSIIYNMKKNKYNLNKYIKYLYKNNFSEKLILKDKNDMFFIKIKKNILIKKIKLYGNKFFKSKILKKLILSNSGDFFSSYVINDDINNLIDSYKNAGILFCDIHYKIQKNSDFSINVVIIFNENILLTIKNIMLVGNRTFKDDIIYSQLNSKVYLWKKNNIYNQDNIELDKKKLIVFYKKNGFLDFNIISTKILLSNSKKSIFLIFVIDEGEQYKFNGHYFVSNLTYIKDNILNKMIIYNKGDIANILLIEDSIEKIKDYFIEMKMFNINIVYDIVKKKENTISVKFYIYEDNEFFLNKINIHGNFKTDDNIIRRELPIFDQHFTNIYKLKILKKKLYNLEYFKLVTYKKNIVKQNKINIDIDLKENSTGTLNVSAGYSNILGPITNFLFVEKNFLGKGNIISFNCQKSKKNYILDISYFEPKIFDNNLGFGGNIFLNSIKKNQMNIKNIGFNLGISYDIFNSFYYKVNYNFKDENIFYNNNIYNKILHQPKKQIISSIEQNLIFYKINKSKKKNNNYTFKFINNISGFGIGTKFVKNLLEIEYYKNLYKEKIFLSIINKYGYIYGYNLNFIDIINNFFLIDDCIRGFESIGPKTYVKNIILGGKMFYTCSIEFLFLVKNNVKLGIFVDLGNLFNTDIKKYQLLKKKIKIFDDSFNRLSCGMGLIWNSPVGKVRIDYSIPLKYKEKLDTINKLRVTLG